MNKATGFFMALSAFLLGIIVGSRLGEGGGLFCGNNVDCSVIVKGNCHNTYERKN